MNAMIFKIFASRSNAAALIGYARFDAFRHLGEFRAAQISQHERQSRPVAWLQTLSMGMSLLH
tara:strand:- start:50 stop:238 length:189 start_codon:yes stop_codon:yes gene_type:complete